jgi:hypothetical protein
MPCRPSAWVPPSRPRRPAPWPPGARAPGHRAGARAAGRPRSSRSTATRGVVQQLEAVRREVIAPRLRRARGRARGKAERRRGAAVPRRASPRSSRSARSTACRSFPSRPSPTQIQRLGAEAAGLEEHRDVLAEFLKASGRSRQPGNARAPPSSCATSSLDQIARMKDGEAALQPMPNGANVVIGGVRAPGSRWRWTRPWRR